jgi:hypothetical protein
VILKIITGYKYDCSHLTDKETEASVPPYQQQKVVNKSLVLDILYKCPASSREVRIEVRKGDVLFGGPWAPSSVSVSCPHCVFWVYRGLLGISPLFTVPSETGSTVSLFFCMLVLSRKFFGSWGLVFPT